VTAVDEERARALLDEERTRLNEIRAVEEDDAGVLDGDDQGLAEEAGGQHPGDVGSETSDRSLAFGRLEDIQRDLADVEDALRRLDEGTYGVCEVCGKPIPDERLEANPTARYDIEHERTVEAAGRIPGDTPQRT
jgi:DnaK suppressor protein